jgi:hypothetical protein
MYKCNIIHAHNLLVAQNDIKFSVGPNVNRILRILYMKQILYFCRDFIISHPTSFLWALSVCNNTDMLLQAFHLKIWVVFYSEDCQKAVAFPVHYLLYIEEGKFIFLFVVLV